jgi:hypothetical protein
MSSSINNVEEKVSPPPKAGFFAALKLDQSGVVREILKRNL